MIENLNESKNKIKIFTQSNNSSIIKTGNLNKDENKINFLLKKTEQQKNLKYNNNNKNINNTSNTLTSKKRTINSNLKSDSLSSTEFDPSKLEFLHKFLRKENALEDEHMTMELFNIIKIDEFVCTIFVTLSIMSSLIYYETRNCLKSCEKNTDIKNDTMNLSLLICSISNILFIITLIPKYIHYFKLNICAKYISNIDKFYQTDLIYYLIIEIILALIHPNLLLKNKYVTCKKSWNMINVKYQINDFLIAINIIRVFYLIKIYVFCSNFYNARSDRVCKLTGKQLNFFFAFKCLLVENSITTLITVTIITIFGFSYLLKIIEGPISIQNKDEINNYNSFLNCFWNVFVTMTTVGYGDYYPLDFLGRFITFFIALSGNLLVALIIVGFQNKTELSIDEKNALNFIQRLEQKDNIKKFAASYFKSNFSFVIMKRKLLRDELQINEKNKKKIIELAKDTFEKRKKFKEAVHTYHVFYKMEDDVDKVKKKISKLDESLDDMNKNISKITNKIKNLIENIGKTFDQTI